MESIERYQKCVDFHPGERNKLKFQSLLADPNPASPANKDAAKLFIEEFDEYSLRVFKVVEDSWEYKDYEV